MKTKIGGSLIRQNKRRLKHTSRILGSKEYKSLIFGNFRARDKSSALFKVTVFKNNGFQYKKRPRVSEVFSS